ncbi:MAG: hypothetical protein ACI4TZ_04150 [Christensenellales bacterium]
MCKLFCYDKLAELSKKYQLKQMLNASTRDMLNGLPNRDKMLDYIKNFDCCKNCKRAMK